MNQPFILTEKQKAAIILLGGDQVHTMLYGGSRSTKSFTLVRTIFLRAIKASGSRHLCVRFRGVHIKSSLVVDTIPKMLRLCFPQLAPQIDHKKGDGYFLLPNKSEVWYAGIDDKERADKVLGQEYVSIMLNECSQIPWLSRELLMSRLAQKVMIDGTDQQMSLRAYYDENPPLKTHWSYKLFIEHRDPITEKRLANPGNYRAMQMNPADNAANLPTGYMAELDAMSARQRKRFKEGEFGDAGEGALWSIEQLEQQRHPEDEALPNWVRIVVAVDPSGASSPDEAARDEIGIVVAGLGDDGIAYVLEDVTVKGSPATWGNTVISACDRWGADVVIGEENYGGAMVRHVIQTADAAYEPTPVGVRYQAVTATRGKIVRAEPISALYEAGKVKHLAGLGKLEDELVNFTAFGYIGDRSPNRADAAIWALTALFPRVISAAKAEANSGVVRLPPRQVTGYGQMKRKRYGR